MDQKIYNEYVAILREELIPAMGCTEPTAVALAAAKARQVLGCMPERIDMACSGNIIKNVQGVIVPQTGDLKGIDLSAALGALAGNPQNGLELFAEVKPEEIEQAKELVKQGICNVTVLDSSSRLHIIARVSKGESYAEVEIRYTHTCIVRVEKDGQILYKNDEVYGEEPYTDRSLLNLHDIYTFANEVEIKDIDKLIGRQIECNKRIAFEGLEKPYGAQVGPTLLASYGGDIRTYARALAAAGCDARMGGCVLTVIINSGSGNQGMTVSLPVIAYAEYLDVKKDKLYRALVLSNLVALLQKRSIGRLSAYCGAVCAACGSGAAITYLYGGGFETIEKTITNTLANVSGIVCDGAKASCAAKIAAAVDAAILAHEMAMKGLVFRPGDGLVKKDAEQTVESVGRMAKNGMKETDEEILRIMIEA